MDLKIFSEKQLETLIWWWKSSATHTKEAIICDGAVRSGKTLCMGYSFIDWACRSFSNCSFAICGKTIRSVRRNILNSVLPAIMQSGYRVAEKISENEFTVSWHGGKNRFYLFGGKDEASAALIQGLTLAGVLFDEVALMPQSFVEQALARCSVTGAKFWFNCNPESPSHWFYREWISRAKERNALYLHFTMEDNPGLAEETKARYRHMFAGPFYKRFVEGRWVAAEGLVYPFAVSLLCDVPEEPFEDWAVSCDYGTVNPCSFGLWGLKEDCWYRVDEYYFSSRERGEQRTDDEHYAALEELCRGKNVREITVDPSAASFAELIRRRGKFTVIPAVNDVVSGIRQVASALKTGRIRICKPCVDTIREFSLYRWQDDLSKDAPVKENDHAMDDIRYFVSTLLNREDSDRSQAFLSVTR